MHNDWWVWRALDRRLREYEDYRRREFRILIENQETIMAAIDNLRTAFTDLKGAVTEGLAELTDLLSKLSSANTDPAVQEIADEMAVVGTGIREAVAASNAAHPDTTPPPVDPPPTPSGA